MALAACTKSLSRIETASLRKSLVYQGHQAMAMAIIALVRVGPNMAEMAIASNRGGKLKNTSVILIIASSNIPPE